jgi:hypothetical protein
VNAIEHLDFDPEPGCGTQTVSGPCAVTPVTHRLLGPCGCGSPLLCDHHAHSWGSVLRRNPVGVVFHCPCGEFHPAHDVQVVPL